MELLRLLPEFIDMRSFSNLWFWIVLAVMWSRASHRVLGVPWDLVARARRGNDPQAVADVVALATISCRRFEHISRTGGAVLTTLIFTVVTALLVLGFGYGLHMAQALALLLLPMLLVGALARRKAALVLQGGLGTRAIFRLLTRQRIAVQLIGMLAIFVTSLWGMYQNLFSSILGN